MIDFQARAGKFGNDNSWVADIHFTEDGEYYKDMAFSEDTFYQIICRIECKVTEVLCAEK